MARARYVETDLGDGLPPWRRVVCLATGESVDVRNRHPGHVLRALAQLSEACSCGARWHFEERACVLCGATHGLRETATGSYCERCYDETSRLIDPDRWDRIAGRQ